MSDRWEERALTFWSGRAACPDDDHGGRDGSHYYQSECAYCLAALLRSVADEARREEAAAHREDHSHPAPLKVAHPKKLKVKHGK